jgi:hypothetical protein
MIDPHERTKPAANGTEFHLADGIPARGQRLDIDLILAAKQFGVRIDWWRNGHLPGRARNQPTQDHRIALWCLVGLVAFCTHQNEMPAGQLNLITWNDLRIGHARSVQKRPIGAVLIAHAYIIIAKDENQMLARHGCAIQLNVAILGFANREFTRAFAFERSGLADGLAEIGDLLDLKEDGIGQHDQAPSGNFWVRPSPRRVPQ